MRNSRDSPLIWLKTSSHHIRQPSNLIKLIFPRINPDKAAEFKYTLAPLDNSDNDLYPQISTYLNLTLYKQIWRSLIQGDPFLKNKNILEYNNGQISKTYSSMFKSSRRIIQRNLFQRKHVQLLKYYGYHLNSTTI